MLHRVRWHILPVIPDSLTDQVTFQVSLQRGSYDFCPKIVRRCELITSEPFSALSIEGTSR